MSIQERVRQLPTPTDDTSQEFEAYKNRMGYDAAKMKSIRYKMSVYDEFLEELEARKKYHGTKAYGRQSTRKRDRGERLSLIHISEPRDVEESRMPSSA